MDFLYEIWDGIMLVVCILQNLVMSILAVMIMAINGVVSALAAIIQWAISILPSMSPPNWAGFDYWATITGWANWFFPIGVLVLAFTTATTLYLIWLAISVVLRWGKATS